MNITLIGRTPLSVELPVDLGDGYEVKLADVSVPKARYNSKLSGRVDYRLGGNAARLDLPHGYFETVSDFVTYLNFLLSSTDRDNTITFQYNKFTHKVAVVCTGRAMVQLHRPLNEVLGLPSGAIRNTVSGSAITFNKTQQYGVLLCESAEVQQYNNVLLPLLTVVPLDNNLYREGSSDSFVKLRRLAGERKLTIRLLDSATMEPLSFIDGNVLLRLHVRKCA